MRSLGQRHRVALKHQVYHKQVYGCTSYNSEESSDIPQRHITKSGQEPKLCVKFSLNMQSGEDKKSPSRRAQRTREIPSGTHQVKQKNSIVGTRHDCRITSP